MKSLCTLITGLVLAFSTLGTANADPVRVAPFVQAKQEYSDNILFTEDNETSDSITTLTAGLEIEQKTKRLNAGFSGQYDKLLYWDHDELNALDYLFKADAAYQVTERLNSRVDAKYSKDSRRDRDTDTTGLLVTGDRKVAALSLGTDYLFSEIRKADLSLDLERSEREEIDDLEDTDSIGVNFAYNRNLSEYYKNTSGIMNVNYLHYSSDTEETSRGTSQNSKVFQETSSDIIQISAGVTKDITELYNVYFLLGGSYTQTTEQARTRRTASSGAVISDTTGPEYDDDTWGGVLSAGVNYKDEYYDILLSVDQSMRGGTGTSGAVQRSSISGGIDRKVTDRFYLMLDASCYLNKNERQISADTEDLTFNIQPGLRYELGRDFVLSMIYRFTSVEDLEDDTTTERSLVYLAIRKEFEIY